MKYIIYNKRTPVGIYNTSIEAQSALDHLGDDNNATSKLKIKPVEDGDLGVMAHFVVTTHEDGSKTARIYNYCRPGTVRMVRKGTKQRDSSNFSSQYTKSWWQDVWAGSSSDAIILSD